MAMRIVPNVAPSALTAADGGKNASNVLSLFGFPNELSDAQLSLAGAEVDADPVSLDPEAVSSPDGQQADGQQNLPTDPGMAGALAANIALPGLPAWLAQPLQPALSSGSQQPAAIQAVDNPTGTANTAALMPALTPSTYSGTELSDIFRNRPSLQADTNKSDAGALPLAAEPAAAVAASASEAQGQDSTRPQALVTTDPMPSSVAPDQSLSSQVVAAPPNAVTLPQALASQQHPTAFTPTAGGANLGANEQDARAQRIEMASITTGANSSADVRLFTAATEVNSSVQNSVTGTAVVEPKDADASRQDGLQALANAQTDQASLGLAKDAPMVDSEQRSIYAQPVSQPELTQLADQSVPAEVATVVAASPQRTSLADVAAVTQFAPVNATPVTNKPIAQAASSSKTQLASDTVEATLSKGADVLDSDLMAHRTAKSVPVGHPLTQDESGQEPKEGGKAAVANAQNLPLNAADGLRQNNTQAAVMDQLSDSPQAISSHRKATEAQPDALSIPGMAGTWDAKFLVAEPALKLMPHQTRLDHPDVSARVIQMAQSGGGEVRIDVTPPDESSFKITLTMQGGQEARLVVTGASDSTRTRLDQTTDQLRQQFAQMGLNLSLDFNQSSFHHSNWQDKNLPDGLASTTSPSGPNLRDTALESGVTQRGSQGAGMINLYA